MWPGKKGGTLATTGEGVVYAKKYSEWNYMRKRVMKPKNAQVSILFLDWTTCYAYIRQNVFNIFIYYVS